MAKTVLQKLPFKEKAEKIIKTRFGETTVDTNKVIYFPHGLLGMPQVKNFYIATYPNKKVLHYLLLQAVEDENLCFLIVPLAPEFYSHENSLLAKVDVISAMNQYDIIEGEGIVILIATIHNNNKNNTSKVSVNLKAPLIIDTRRLVGYQHIFVKKDYSIKHYL